MTGALRRAAAALALLAAVAAHAQVDEAREAQKRGSELQRAGDLGGALRAFDRVVELMPSSPFGWYNRGLVRREMNDCRQASADFTRALELDPGMFNALYQRGNCRQALGDYQGAVADYTRAAELPGQIHARFLAYYRRGDAHRRLGRLEEAHADYTTAASLRTDTAALRSRAWVSFYLGRFAPAHADLARHVHETEGKEPDVAYSVILAALALERAGRAMEAAQFVAQWDHRVGKDWPAPVVRYLNGALGEEALLDLASGPGERTEALAYIGQRLLGSGAREAGLERLRRVLREGEPGYLEYDLAYHELRRLGLATASDRRERKP